MKNCKIFYLVTQQQSRKARTLFYFCVSLVVLM